MAAPEKVGLFKRARSKVMSKAKSQLGALLLVSAAFVLGYTAKNMEDHNELMMAHGDLQEQQQQLTAACTQQLYQLDQAHASQMKERDDRLNEQLTLIGTQHDMIANLQATTNTIAQRQKTTLVQRKAELTEVKKAVTAAQQAATGASTADKAYINTLVKKGKQK